MAGYIFNLDSEESLVLYTSCGVYATVLNISENINHWNTAQLGTLADYVTMKPGDNVYFFIKRKIYGIGQLVSIDTEKISDCKFNNFPEASKPKYYNYEEVKDKLLWNEGDYSNSQRWICCFIPSPAFFRTGVDMDEVLASDTRAFKMLRAFWKVSFIKQDCKRLFPRHGGKKRFCINR